MRSTAEIVAYLRAMAEIIVSATPLHLLAPDSEEYQARLFMESNADMLRWVMGDDEDNPHTTLAPKIIDELRKAKESRAEKN